MLNKNYQFDLIQSGDVVYIK